MNLYPVLMDFDPFFMDFDPFFMDFDPFFMDFEWFDLINFIATSKNPATSLYRRSD